MKLEVEKMSRSKYSPDRPLKIFIVGDRNVGKTSLLISYTKDTNPIDCHIDFFETLRTTIHVDGADHAVTIWNAAGHEQHNRLSHVIYPDTDGFILCYSVDDPSSFNNLLANWYPQIRQQQPNVPLIIVGTKLDLKKDSTIPSEEIEKLKSKIGAQKWLECSAVTGQNLNKVFVEAVRAALTKPWEMRRNGDKSCNNCCCVVS